MDASTIFLACVVIMGVVAFVEVVRRILEKIAATWFEDEEDNDETRRETTKNDEYGDNPKADKQKD